MPTITGQSVTAPANGTLKLIGTYYGWCGSCGCSVTELIDTAMSWAATQGTTYSIVNKGKHQTCQIYRNGVPGDVLGVSNTPYANTDSPSGSAFQWLPGSYYLEFTYDDPKYDCINGECILASQYDTPGQYLSLEDCQAECGSCSNSCNPPNICVAPDHCPDGYVCIGSDEWVEIKRLLN